MRQFWQVFFHEYSRHVFRWRFLLVLLSLPGMALASVALMLIILFLMFDQKPVGYIDMPGVFTGSAIETPSEGINDVEFVPFTDEAQARSALLANEIQAYYILPADFYQSHRVELYYQKKPLVYIQSNFETRLREQFLVGYPAGDVKRMAYPPVILPRMIAAAGVEPQPGQPAAGGLSFVRILVAFGLIFLLSTAISMCSGYLVNTIVDEKTNRTIEILVTSVSPHQLMLGKLFASISIGLTQVLIWIGLPVLILVPIILFTAPQMFDLLPELPLLLGLFAALALPTFLLMSAVVSSASAVVADGRQGSDIVPLVTLNFTLPALLYPVVSSNPNGTIAVIFSIFPPTAFTTMMLRLAHVVPPTWQLLLSVSLLLLSSAAALWFSGWLFRWGMLRYGQELRWKDVWALIKR